MRKTVYYSNVKSSFHVQKNKKEGAQITNLS